MKTFTGIPDKKGSGQSSIKTFLLSGPGGGLEKLKKAKVHFG